MKILLNMATLRKTGGLVVGLGLCQGFVDNNTDDEFYLIYPPNCGYEKFGTHENWHLYPVDEKFGVGLSRIWTDQVKIPRLVKRNIIDVLLTATSMGTYRPGCKHCVFIQLPYLAYKNDELQFNRNSGLTGKFKDFYFKCTLKHTDAMIVQTDVMKERMCNRWKFESDRIYPILPAVPVLDIDDIPDVLPEGVAKKNYLIYPAGAMPHKNIIVIPGLLKWLREHGHELKFIVTADRNSRHSEIMMAKAAELGVSDLIVQTGVVGHSTVLGYIKNALAMVMPTLLETFGIPYIEAMSLKCPVLTSDMDFAHCVCGTAAKYFNPHSSESIGQRVLECMELEQATILIKNGEDRIRDMFISRTNATVAKEFLEIFKKC